RDVERQCLFLWRRRCARLSEYVPALRAIRTAQQRAGAARAGARDRLHPEADGRGAKTRRRGRAERCCDRALPRQDARRLSRHGLGRLQELVFRYRRHADPLAAAAGPASRFPRRAEDGGFGVRAADGNVSDVSASARYSRPRPREGRGPFFDKSVVEEWIPAFAGKGPESSWAADPGRFTM